jgi:hypothetical protein
MPEAAPIRFVPRHRLSRPNFSFYNLQFHFFNPPPDHRSPPVAAPRLAARRADPQDLGLKTRG